MSGFLGFIFIVVCSTFQNGCSNLGVLSDTIWSETLSLLRVSIGLLFTKIEEKILIFHFVLFTFSFNSLSVFTLHCNILSWNLLKWPPIKRSLTWPARKESRFWKWKKVSTNNRCIIIGPQHFIFSICLCVYKFRFWFLVFFFSYWNGRALH